MCVSNSNNSSFPLNSGANPKIVLSLWSGSPSSSSDCFWTLCRFTWTPVICVSRQPVLYSMWWTDLVLFWTLHFSGFGS